jgi:hypothetical protein
MKPLAICTLTVGCAKVGELSAVTAPSVWNAHVTPALLTPRQTVVVTVAVRASWRIGAIEPCADWMIDGSTKTGMPNPPAVVV